MAWFYGWMYGLNTYMAFLAGRDGVYAILAWGEKPSDFPLTTFQLFSYAVWGGMTAIHATLYSFDQVRFFKSLKDYKIPKTIILSYDGRFSIISKTKSRCKLRKSPAVVPSFDFVRLLLHISRTH